MNSSNPVVYRNEPMQLRALLLHALPHVSCDVDVPSNISTGVFWIDCMLDGHLVEVCWQREGAWKGFGISCAKTTYYGENPDEMGVATPEEACARVVHLLTTKTFTREEAP